MSVTACFVGWRGTSVVVVGVGGCVRGLRVGWGKGQIGGTCRSRLHSRADHSRQDKISKFVKWCLFCNYSSMMIERRLNPIFFDRGAPLCNMRQDICVRI